MNEAHFISVKTFSWKVIIEASWVEHDLINFQRANASCTPTCVCADFYDFSTYAWKLGAAPNGDARTQLSISTHAHVIVNEALVREDFAPY